MPQTDPQVERLTAQVRWLTNELAQLRNARPVLANVDNADQVDGYHAAVSGASAHVVATDASGIIRSRQVSSGFSSATVAGLANAGAIASFALGSTYFIGLLIVIDNGGRIGLFGIGYNNACYELHDPSNVYSAVKATAGMSNVYVEGNTAYIQNNSTVNPNTYFLSFIGYAP